MHSKLALFHRGCREFLAEEPHRRWSEREAFSVHRFVENMADYIRGLYDWQAESARYGIPRARR